MERGQSIPARVRCTLAHRLELERFQKPMLENSFRCPPGGGAARLGGAGRASRGLLTGQ